MEEENKRLWDTYLSLVKKEYSDHANNKRKGKQRRNQKHEEDSESINGFPVNEELLEDIEQGSAENNRQLVEEFENLRDLIAWMISSNESKSLRQLRRIKEQEQLYLLAQNELSDVNIPEYLKEHLKEYVHRDAQALEDYLCHEDLLI